MIRPEPAVLLAVAERVYFVGVEALRARHYRQALQAFREAAALVPTQVGYLAAVGWALFREAPTDPQAVAAGLAELQRAVAMDPANPSIRTSLGRYYAETGHPEKALIELEAALAMNDRLPGLEEEIQELRAHRADRR